jgi:hypothetical protein
MSKRGPFKSFKAPRADARTFKPAGESRQAFTDRVHAEVLAGESIQDLWLTYYTHRFANRSSKPLEPEHVELLREVFYAGVATMFHLALMSAEGGDTEAEVEAGAARMQRLHEELATYERGLR